jgi:hypothetical protein
MCSGSRIRSTPTSRGAAGGAETDGLVVETTNPHPSFWKRWMSAIPLGDTTGLAPILALAVVHKVTPDIAFETTVPLAPEQAYNRVKSGLLAVCRTRVLSRYPKPISASCYYGEFDGGLSSNHPSLNLEFTITPAGTEHARITVHCRSGGNTSRPTHELKRREVRRLIEWIAAQ